MFVALDIDKKRVHANNAYVNGDWRCPSCGMLLTYKKGKIRRAYFAHRKNNMCTDTWSRGTDNSSYDVSEWHNDWQNEFPADNQEIQLTWDNITHRADILTGRTVIEFQHSVITEEHFSERNNYYFNFGYKIIWLFDMRELYSEEKIQEVYDKEFSWIRPYRAFKYFDRYQGQAELFFQLKETTDNQKCIVRIKSTAKTGFETFTVSDWYTKQEFLDYTKKSNGNYEPPLFYDDLTDNAEFKKFKNNYGIVLSQEQDRAVQSVEGAVLLLAVPGSGKTSTLIARLGYMIFCRNIPPENILVLSYTNAAANEVRERFIRTYRVKQDFNLRFATLNSFCLEVIKYKSATAGNKYNYTLRDRQSTLRNLYKSIYNKFLSKSELIEYDTIIGYIKNMMLYENERSYSHYEKSDVYKRYISYCQETKIMDYDDQLIFAYQILTEDNAVRTYFENKYKYICVDEAQDNSKLQYEIINLISRKSNNILMVGDEDQSIFGYRGAYPRALLNFRNTYKNTFTLQIKRNFRSTKSIISKANQFIFGNTDREPKKMVCTREYDTPVIIQGVESRKEQYKVIAKLLSDESKQTAVLTRLNDSLIPLIYFLSENNISYSLNREYQVTFFNSKIYRGLMTYLQNNTDSRPSDLIVEYALSETLMYSSGLEDLFIISEKYRTVKEYIDRLEKLETEVEMKSKQKDLIAKNTLSTIHCSKGMEFKNVILMDVFDGLLPLSSSRSEYYQSEHEFEQEERRLFYVGMTRAIDRLVLMDIGNRRSLFIEEISDNDGTIEYHPSPLHSESIDKTDLFTKVNELEKIREEQLKKQKEEEERIQREKSRKLKEVEDERKRQEKLIIAEKNRIFVLNCFSSPDVEKINEKIIDFNGKWWLKCRICNEIKEESEFISRNDVVPRRFGKCRDCMRKQSQKYEENKFQREQELKRKKLEQQKIDEECRKEVLPRFEEEQFSFFDVSPCTDYIYDRFGRRWLKCICCNQVKLEKEFGIKKDGVYGINNGKCSECD